MVHLTIVTSSKVQKYQVYESELSISGVKYPVDIKVIDKFEHQNNISVNFYGCKDKKSSCYVLWPCTLQDIEWIYYISLLVKHLITYCWKTWAGWHQDKVLITTTKNISDNIVYMTKPEILKKKYLKRCKLHGALSLQKRMRTTFTFCHLCGFQKCFI